MKERVDINNFIGIAVAQAITTQVDQQWQAEVEALPGVLAIGSSLNECLTDLKEAIEGWIEVRQMNYLDIPSLKLRSTEVSLA